MNLFKRFLSKPLKRSKAFTVGELTTATMVLGTISVITLGVLVHSIDEKKQAVAKTILNKEIAISLAEMYADDELAGKDLTTFQTNFEKYFPVRERVSDETANSYFAEEFNYTDENGKEIEAIIQPADKGNASKEINLSALPYKFVTDKGVSVAIGYNSSNLSGTTLKYIAEKGTLASEKANANYEAQNQALGSIYGIYDVNGPKGPNQLGKDVGVFGQIKSDGTVSKTYGQLTTDKKLEDFVAGIPQDNLEIESTSIDKEGKKTTVISDNTKGWCINEYGDVACCLSETHCSVQGKKLISDINKKLCYCAGTDTKDQKSDRCVHISGDLFAPTKCKNNGGTWNSENCKCDCGDIDKEGTALNICNKKSNGAAIALDENLCACQCKDQNGIIAAAQNNVDVILGKTNINYDYQDDWIDPSNAGQFTTQCINCVTTDSKTSAVIKNIEHKYCMGSCPEADVKSCEEKRKGTPTLSLTPFDSNPACKCLCRTESKDSGAYFAVQNIKTYQNALSDSIDAKVTSAKEDAANADSVFKKKIFTGKCDLVYKFFDVSLENGGHSPCSNCGSNNGYKRKFISDYNQYKNSTIADLVSHNKPTIKFDKDSCAYQFDKNGGLIGSDRGSYSDTIAFHGFTSKKHIYNSRYGYRYEVATKLTVTRTKNKIVIGYNPNQDMLVENFENLFLTKYLKTVWKDSYWNDTVYVNTYHCSQSEWWDPIIMAPFNNGGYTPKATVPTEFKLTNADTDKVGLYWLNWNQDPAYQQYLLVKANNCTSGNCSIVDGLFSDVATYGNNGYATNRSNKIGTNYENGLQELSDLYDVNQDGLVNDQDGNMDKLALWGDANQDAIVNNGEIVTCVGRDAKRCEANGKKIKILEINTTAETNQGTTGAAAQNDTLTYTITGQYTILEQVYEPKNAYLQFDEYTQIKYNNKVYNAKKYTSKNSCNAWGCTTDNYYFVPNFNNNSQGGAYKHRWFKIDKNYYEEQARRINNNNINNNNDQNTDNNSSNTSATEQITAESLIKNTVDPIVVYSLNTKPMGWLLDTRIHVAPCGNSNCHFQEVEKTRQNLYDVRFAEIIDDSDEE